MLTLETMSKSVFECCHNLLYQWSLTQTPDPCVRGMEKIRPQSGRGGILNFVFGQLIDISLEMSLILMSVSQLITVYHIIVPQSSVFLRIVLFLLPPEQSSTVRGVLVTVGLGGGVNFGFCFVSFHLSFLVQSLLKPKNFSC